MSDRVPSPAGKKPLTPIHCEPIGNLAVQLSGSKQWTLLPPESSFLLSPALSPDGRAFILAHATPDQIERLPSYSIVTNAGDALWIPTWTWHGVEYTVESEEEISMGASLFHFRPWDFVVNNGVFSMVIVPSLIRELIGWNTQ